MGDVGGELVLAEASPAAFKPLARAQVLPAVVRAFPALDNGILYVTNETTMVALRGLYQKASPGGFVIIDDYSVIPACRLAVHDFRDAHGVSDPITSIDTQGVFWRKS